MTGAPISKTLCEQCVDRGKPMRPRSTAVMVDQMELFEKEDR